ncbi:MAG TPA: carboxypeptidase-like regulatory domain-containing protein, partial [Acidobacteriaceae bacterium]|nr:carboxypeptidase-like regulatory domain-containing protein [Acidobacteriaceae bacterium]
MSQAKSAKNSAFFATVRFRSLVLSSVVIAVLVALSTRCSAQATGSVLGNITDPAGRTVAAAHVELSNTETGSVRTAQSHEDGSYVFPLVAPGTYAVQVMSSGFKASVTRDVKVLVNDTSRVDVKL